ncbi:succinate--CoA ligase subunit alpha [bacterium]|nr:succinate--CoA ligase subunit alpha [bacterium]
MSVWLSPTTKVLVQGMTGREGAYHAAAMIDYGTNVVAGVTPGRGGMVVADRHIYDHVIEAVTETGATASVLFVPARFAKGAALEAIEAGISLLVVITEGVPLKDEMEIYHKAKAAGCVLIGPNCPGLLDTRGAKMGIMPAGMFTRGKVGVVSRSGTLTYELVHLICNAGLGISTAIGVGGDQIIGARFADVLRAFDEDPDTEAVAMVGEIGGSDEEEAAEIISSLSRLQGKVVGFISGLTAPKGKRMGHAGAIVEGGIGDPLDKVEAFKAAGVPVPGSLAEIPALLADMLG